MNKNIFIVLFGLFFFIVVTVGVVIILETSHRMTDKDKNLPINMYSQVITKSHFIVERLEYSAYETTSCMGDDLFVKGIVDIGFDKQSLPEYCDIFSNGEHMKSITQIHRKCVEGCDEYGMVYNVGLTLVKDERNTIRICCDDICQETYLEALCP